jgi:DNA-binding NtrC family response regulator
MPHNREPILTADGDKAFRRAVSSLFDEAGYVTREASSSEEALRLALAQRPAAAIVGVVLRGSAGTRSATGCERRSVSCSRSSSRPRPERIRSIGWQATRSAPTTT